MATNPLPVPVTGGTPEPYVAGLGVQAPRITGAPIAAPSNISEILALLNGTAQTVANTREMIEQKKVQSERRTRQETEDADRSDLHLLQKESELWKVMAENDPIVLHSKPFADHLDKLKAEADNAERSPFYQAQVASYLAHSTAFKQNTLYTQGARAEAEANKQDAAIRKQDAWVEQAQAKMERDERRLATTVISDIQVLVAKAESDGIPTSQISKMIDEWGLERGADHVPAIKEAVHLYRNSVETEHYTKLAAAVEEAAKDQYINDAGDLPGFSLTLMNEKRIEDPETRGKVITQVAHSVSGLIDPLIARRDFTAAGLGATFAKLEDLEASAKAVPNQTTAQQDATNRVVSIVAEAKEKVLANLSSDVMAQTIADVNNTRRNQDVPQRDIPKFVASVLNEKLGINAISYSKDTGYTSSIAEFKSMMPRLDTLTESINDQMNREAPEREAMERLIGTFKSATPAGKGVTPANTGSPNNSNEVSIPEETPGGGEPLDTGVNPSMVPPKLHEIQPMAVVDDATLRLAKFNPDTVPIDTLRYVISRYPKGTDLGYFKPTVEKFVSNPLLPNGEFNKDGYERTMAILNGTQYGRSIAIQGYDGLSEPKTIRLIKTAIWGNLRHLATSGDPADVSAAKLAKGIIGNSEDKNSYQSYMAWMDTPQNPAGSVKNNDVELDFGKTLKNTYGGKLIASPALKDILQAADMAAGKDNPKYKEDTDEARLLQRETHKVLLQSLGISLVDSGTSVRAIRDTYGHAPSNPQKTLDAVLALKPDWSSPMHRSTLKEVLNREPTMLELNETKGWNMERLLHYGGPNRITGSKLTIGNYSNIPERSLIDEREYEEDGVTKNPSYGKGLVFEKTPLSYARNKAGTIRVKGFSNQNYRELFSWGIGVTGSERMDEHFYINSTIESMVDNLIEQDHYTDR